MDVLGQDTLARAFGTPGSPVPVPELPEAFTLSSLRDANPKTKSKPAAHSWRDLARSVDSGASRRSNGTAAESSAPHVRPFDRALLTSMDTLSTQYNLSICPHCKRPCIDSVLPLHIDECIENPRSEAGQARMIELSVEVKSESARPHATQSDDLGTDDLSDASTESSISSAWASRSASERPSKQNSKNGRNGHAKVNGVNGTSTNGFGADGSDILPPSFNGDKKRKAADSDASRKRTKKVQKPSKPKAREPYNPDKQCGVLLPSGQPCMRSLTCKVHSIGAKRAVTGRSAPFSVLLANYQQRQSLMKQVSQSTDPDLAADANQDEVLSPEKEVQQVMEGIRRRVNCYPLDRRVIMPTRLRNRNFRLREMLALALLPKGVPAGGDALYGRALSYNPEDLSSLQYVRAPAVQRYLAMLQQQQRRMAMQMGQQSQAVPAAVQAAQAQAHAQGQPQPQQGQMSRMLPRQDNSGASQR